MSRIYTTKTPSLKATIADVRILDVKKLTLNGKNILDYISDSEFNSYDTRDPQLKNDELDIWNTEISLSEEGHIEVKPFEHYYYSTNSTQDTTLKSAVKVIDNEVLGADDAHLMYWQTDGLMSGDYMFNDCSNLESFSSDLSSMTEALGMFSYCSNLESFSSDLSSLTFSQFMFDSCTNLTSFTSDLSSLTDGANMFYGCSNLTTFTSDLSSLINGDGMFYECTNLNSFSSELPNLTNSGYMFFYCSNLESFTSDLSSLIEGSFMFCDCENLTSFNANLPSLTNGYGMFSGCKLDAHSVANIIHSLPQRDYMPDDFDFEEIPEIEYYIGYMTLGLGCDDTEEDKLLFAQECDCETWQELLDEFSAKNWKVQFECNGRPTTTYNMRRGETLPIYAKLEEVIMPTDEKERKLHYAYTSADGSKFYNIHYFHSTNGSTEGYDVFSSLEEAISTYNVTPKI